MKYAETYYHADVCYISVNIVYVDYTVVTFLKQNYRILLLLIVL